ncbi:MAG: hypothetical protein E6I20_11365 [Chloroflexi bacterium]|nr:MAG: hypothetical protein E6I20_11365 [Chloroflexota bacterium]
MHDVKEGDACPRCGSPLTLRRGVEVGNIFKLGTYYSSKMEATYLAADGSRKPFIMGSYGIGVGRCLQTIIETHHDDKGISWPISVAPFQAHVVALAGRDQRSTTMPYARRPRRSSPSSRSPVPRSFTTTATRAPA